MKKLAFTLVELLIVIGLLGILAVGLLAAIDPFEQFKKGNDTALANLASEIYQATIRYYANTNSVPWGDGTVQYRRLYEGDGKTMLERIMSGGELKADFIDLAGSGKLSKIFFYGSKTDAGVSAAVCFSPDSKSFDLNENTKYTDQWGQNVDTHTTCKSHPPGTADCYWCVK